MSSAQDLEFASSLEIEREIHDKVNTFLMLKDSKLQQPYEEFTGGRQSLDSLLTLCLVFTICAIPIFAVSAANLSRQNSEFEYFNCALIMTVLFSVTAVLWNAYITEHKKMVQEGSRTLSLSSRKYLLRVQMRIFFFIQAIACYRLVEKVVNGPCEQPTTLMNSFGCNPSHDLEEVPSEPCVVSMVIPMVFCMTVRGSHFEFSLLLWLASVLSIVVSMAYLGSINSLIFLLLFSLGVLVVLIESRKSSYFLFFMHRKLQEILLTRQKEADEENAAEMRHMIANVAHDLKTPLSSFLGGVDFITHAIQEVSQLRWKDGLLSVEDLDDLVHSISQCITNMRNTNSFMLMTINRCIDYTKASKGVRLVPKFETIDLMETLSLPLNCMKDIQQRISFVLDATSKDICSHIITDKQWLQENVLCLLSNAVKYSHEGEVRISVSRHVEVDDDTMRSTLDCFEGVNRAGSSGSLFSLHSFRLETGSRYLAMRPLARMSSASENGISSSSSYEYLSQPAAMSLPYASIPLPPLQHSSSLPLAPATTRQSISLLGITREFLRIEVEDHGIGLSDEVISSLFSPFKQAQRLAGGTGLGLFSLAKRIEALEGKCGVARRKDGKEGSLFWFMIPYRPDEPTATAFTAATVTVTATSSAATVSTSEIELGVRKQSFQSIAMGLGPPAHLEKTASTGRALFRNEASPSPMPIGGEGGRGPVAKEQLGLVLDVLVVEDSPTVLKMTTMMLTKHKHIVTTAVNGAEAVKIITERWEKNGDCFDVVLMDLQMPVMDGLEATKRLRRLEQDWSSAVENMTSVDSKRQRTHITIVGVSANSDSATEVAAFGVGFDAFIAKPFSLDTFYAMFQAIQEKK